jgi:hypothetical protein
LLHGSARFRLRGKYCSYKTITPFIPSYRDFDGNNHFERLAAMESAHLQRGFNEIAQNFTTFPDGAVASCRSLDTTPAGVKGANTNGICIENLGNFDEGHDAMTNPQRDCIIRVNALLSQKFNLAPSSSPASSTITGTTFRLAKGRMEVAKPRHAQVLAFLVATAWPQRRRTSSLLSASN